MYLVLNLFLRVLMNYFAITKIDSKGFLCADRDGPVRDDFNYQRPIHSYMPDIEKLLSIPT